MTPAKRAMDVLGAAGGLLLLAPLLAAIAVLVRLCDGPPVLFRQERVGTGGTFRLLKFRTMRGGPGAPITAGVDPRITRLGRWLRRRKLDELPQLWNVLTGDMSLVGPRPELPQLVARYTAGQREVLRYRPGITDPASLRFHDEAALLAGAADPVACYRDIVLPAKLELSLAYARTATPATDLGQLAAAFGLLLSGRRAGADSPVLPAASTHSHPREDLHAPVP